MSVAYTAIPLAEPDETHIDYSSIHTFRRSSFSSIFTYRTVAGADESIAAVQTTAAKVCTYIVTAVGFVFFLITCPISIWFSIKRVRDNEQMVVFRLGRLHALRHPGVVWVLPIIDRCKKVDMRTKAFSVPPQTVMTADGASIELGAEVYYCVKDAVQSVNNIRDLNHSTRLIARTSLQTHCGRHNLDHVEASRNKICSQLEKDINSMTDAWGVNVEKIELSALKVLQQPNPLLSQHTDPLRFLGAILFPPGGNGGLPSNPLVDNLKTAFSSIMAPSGEVNAGSEMSVSDAADLLITKVKPHMGRHLVEQFGCVYTFRLISTDNDAELFYLDLKNGDGSVGKGAPPVGNADATLTLTVGTLLGLMNGEVSTFKAYMSGELQVEGDLQVANQLADLVGKMGS